MEKNSIKSNHYLELQNTSDLTNSTAVKYDNNSSLYDNEENCETEENNHNILVNTKTYSYHLTPRYNQHSISNNNQKAQVQPQSQSNITDSSVKLYDYDSNSHFNIKSSKDKDKYSRLNSSDTDKERDRDTDRERSTIISVNTSKVNSYHLDLRNLKIYEEKIASLNRHYIGEYYDISNNIIFDYMSDNEYITSGYRVNYSNCELTSRSICECHNETGNIWTHLLGALIFLYLLISTYYIKHDEAHRRGFHNTYPAELYNKTQLNELGLSTNNTKEINYNNTLIKTFVDELTIINKEFENEYNSLNKFLMFTVLNDLRDNIEKNRLSKKNENALLFDFNSFNSKLKALPVLEERITLKLSDFSNKFKLDELITTNSSSITTYSTYTHEVEEFNYNIYYLEQQLEKLSLIINSIKSLLADLKHKSYYDNLTSLSKLDNSYKVKDILTNGIVTKQCFDNIVSSISSYVVDLSVLVNSQAVKLYEINKILTDKYKYMNYFYAKKTESSVITSLIPRTYSIELELITNNDNNNNIDKDSEENNSNTSTNTNTNTNKDNLFNLNKKEVYTTTTNKTQVSEIIFTQNFYYLTPIGIQIQCLSSFLCLFLSTLYHTYFPVSRDVYFILRRLDYAGILVAVIGSTIPAYYYYFYCDDTLRDFYCIVHGVLGLVVLLFIIFKNDSHVKSKSVMLVLLVISAFFPKLHIMFYLDERRGMIKNPLENDFYIGGLMIGIGFLFFSTKIPEKIFPGKFDLVINSHQIWHVFVVIGMCYFNSGVKTFYFNRQVHECPVTSFKLV
jgi:channel protein (hemolysin III family)